MIEQETIDLFAESAQEIADGFRASAGNDLDDALQAVTELRRAMLQQGGYTRTIVIGERLGNAVASLALLQAFVAAFEGVPEDRINIVRHDRTAVIVEVLPGPDW